MLQSRLHRGTYYQFVLFLCGISVLCVGLAFSANNIEIGSCPYFLGFLLTAHDMFCSLVNGIVPWYCIRKN